MHKLTAVIAVPVGLSVASCGESPSEPSGPSRQDQPVVASVEVSPGSVTLDALGAGAELSAVARDGSGNTISGKSFTWSTSDGSVALVGSDGLVSATGNGSATITAMTDGVSGTSAITVEQVPWEIEVEPHVATLLAIGETLQLTAVAKDWLDNDVVGASFTWSSSDGGVVSVTDAGLVTAVSGGSATVTATIDQVSGSAGLAVGPAFWEGAGAGPTIVSSLVIVPSTGHIFAGTLVNGMFRSTDGGDSWSSVTSALGDPDIYSLVLDSAGNLLFSTYDSVFRSANNGDTWTNVTTGLDGSMRMLAVGPGGEVYAAQSFGLFRSTDHGDTWLLTGFTDDVDRVAVSGNGAVFVGTELDGLFRSTDDGATWTPINAVSGEDLTIFAIGVDPNTGNLFTCCAGGVFRSTNNGDTWTDLTGSFTHAVFSFGFDAASNIYAGTCEGGVLRSSNGGDSWSPVNSGLTDLIIRTIAVDAADRLFIGTGPGVFRSIEPKTTTVGPPGPRECGLGG